MTVSRAAALPPAAALRGRVRVHVIHARSRLVEVLEILRILSRRARTCASRRRRPGCNGSGPLLQAIQAADSPKPRAAPSSSASGALQTRQRSLLGRRGSRAATSRHTLKAPGTYATHAGRCSAYLAPACAFMNPSTRRPPSSMQARKPPRRHA